MLNNTHISLSQSNSPFGRFLRVLPQKESSVRCVRVVSCGGREDTLFLSRCNLRNVRQWPTAGERVWILLAEANSSSREGASQSSALGDIHFWLTFIVPMYTHCRMCLPSGRCVMSFLETSRHRSHCIAPTQGEMIVMLLQATLSVSRRGRRATSAERYVGFSTNIHRPHHGWPTTG